MGQLDEESVCIQEVVDLHGDRRAGGGKSFDQLKALRRPQSKKALPFTPARAWSQTLYEQVIVAAIAEVNHPPLEGYRPKLDRQRRVLSPMPKPAGIGWAP